MNLLMRAAHPAQTMWTIRMMMMANLLLLLLLLLLLPSCCRARGWLALERR